MKRDLYAEVSARIVAELEAGAAPWVKPWSASPGANTPCNAVSIRPYSGCNIVLLWMAQAAGYRTPRFLTFKQALELGGNVRKGEHGTKVYFVKQLQVRDQGADDSSGTRVVFARARRGACPCSPGGPRVVRNGLAARLTRQRLMPVRKMTIVRTVALRRKAKTLAKSHLRLITPVTEKQTVAPRRRPTAELLRAGRWHGPSGTLTS
jgi:hypothetical protein